MSKLSQHIVHLFKYVATSAIFLGTGAGLLLALATTLWVPLNTELIEPAYYHANLFVDIRTRALLGTFAQQFGFTPLDFIGMLQGFKIGWLCLLCWHIFRWIEDRAIATSLCVLFGFSAAIFSDNVLAGFIDMSANFWLLTGTCLILSPQKLPISTYIRTRLCITALLLFLALLTHEKSIFPTIPLLLWSCFRYRRSVLWLLIPYVAMSGMFGIAIWTAAPTYGLSPAGYTHILFSDAIAYFLNESANALGIFYALGMLWCVYLALSLTSIQEQEKGSHKIAHGCFFIISCTCIAIQTTFARDTLRVMNALWLPIFILLVDQSHLINSQNQRAPSKIIWVLLTTLHLLLPPMFMYGKGGTTPLNCYADRLFPYLQSFDNQKNSFWLWDNGRRDIHGELRCRPSYLTREYTPR